MTVVFYSFYDFFIKLSSGKINDGLNGLIINSVSAIVMLVYVMYTRVSGENPFQFTKEGLSYSVLGGVVIGITTITFIKLFSTGINLSIASPAVRIGSVVLISLLGILILKENVTPKYIFGSVLALSGMYLIMFSK